jgi:hypothetical protein
MSAPSGCFSIRPLGHNRSFSHDLLFQDARICITEAVRGRVRRGGVNGIAVRGRRRASALVCGTPRLLPVVPLPRAFAVLGPGDPPVLLMVLPFESVERPAPVAADDDPDVPPELCARA